MKKEKTLDEMIDVIRRGIKFDKLWAYFMGALLVFYGFKGFYVTKNLDEILVIFAALLILFYRNTQTSKAIEMLYEKDNELNSKVTEIKKIDFSNSKKFKNRK